MRRGRAAGAAGDQADASVEHQFTATAEQPVPGTMAVEQRPPFPEFGLYQGAANAGYSHYNSLGVKFTRRFF